MTRNLCLRNSLRRAVGALTVTMTVAVAVGGLTLSASGQLIYVLSDNGFYGGSGTVGEYNPNGTAVNASLIAGLSYPAGLAISGNNLYLDNSYGPISEYSTSGTLENPGLISLSAPEGLAIINSGSDLFVANFSTGVVGEYTTSGATVNATLITGLTNPDGLAVSGSDLFVSSESGVIGEYTTSGTPLNASLISGLTGLSSFAISGTKMYIADSTDGYIQEYTTSGSLVNPVLITGLQGPNDVAISGSDIFVSQFFGVVGEYTTSGGTVNASLITGLNDPADIAFAPVPEPGTLALIGLGCLIAFRRSGRATGDLN